MSSTEILAELPKLSQRERRRILDRLLELDDESELLEERRHLFRNQVRHDRNHTATADTRKLHA